MKKAKILLAMLLALSVFTFAGCGDNNNDADNNGADNGTRVEETNDNAVEDMKDDAEDLGNDVKDGAKDMLDGTDNTDNTDNNTQQNSETTAK